MPSALLWAYLAEKIFLVLQLRKICGFSGVAFSPEGSWRGVASDTGMTSHREGRYGIPFRKTRVLLLRFGRRPTAADATSRNALSREKANPAGPQPCRICKIQNNVSAATTTTAACGRNRKELLGQRPAGHECRSRHEMDAGCRNSFCQSNAEGISNRSCYSTTSSNWLLYRSA